MRQRMQWLETPDQIRSQREILFQTHVVFTSILQRLKWHCFHALFSGSCGLGEQKRVTSHDLFCLMHIDVTSVTSH